MTSRPGRVELLTALAAGAAGSGLVLLAMRQGWAQVTTAAPRPLPASVIALTGQDLVPAASALALAALAGLAAVLATRRLARRLTGVVLALFGTGIAIVVSLSISAADMLAAAAAQAGPATGAGGGAAAGSTISGSSPGAAAPVAGLAGHPALAGLPWRPAAIAGALLIIAAGLLVTWRADRMPVMSARYEAPPGRAGAGGRAGDRAGGRTDEEAGPGEATARRPGVPAGDSAALWESLSRGEDPTAVRRPAGGNAAR